MGRAKIVPGYRCGNLVVVEATEERKSTYIVWRCRCDCGGEILLNTPSLQRGHITDCGCSGKPSPKRRDIRGMRFGRLLAVEPAKTQPGGSTVWRCRCDCGGEVLARLGELTSGDRRSCGCLGHPPLKEYIGLRFGQLTVIDYAGKRDGKHRWKCICDCGNETVVDQTRLQSGKTRSCGCLQTSIITENMKFCEGTSVTILEAMKHGRKSTNRSGYTGVYQKKRDGKWVAQITFKRKTYYLGTFEKMEDAVKARQHGEEMHDDFLEWYYQQHNQDRQESSGETNAE